MLNRSRKDEMLAPWDVRDIEIPVSVMEDRRKGARSERINRLTFGVFGGNYQSIMQINQRIRRALPHEIAGTLVLLLVGRYATKEQTIALCDRYLEKNDGVPFREPTTERELQITADAVAELAQLRQSLGIVRKYA